MIGLAGYVLLFGAACAAGLPLGFALFGRRHAAGWVAGALFGYGLSSMVLWGVVQARIPSAAAFIAAQMLLAAVTWSGLRGHGPWVMLPPWTRRDSLALLLVLALVPLIQLRPFSRLGEPDPSGARQYRAYFTADFLWHVALTSELARFSSPPRNPYLARRPLHYYWSYFVLPAVIVGIHPVLPDVRAHLLVNAFCAGLLFVAAIFVTAWSVVPRAGPVAAAMSCTILAASAEGTYAIYDTWTRNRPLEVLRDLNIDAVTAWWFGTLTIDSLPRSLWYTPQHAMACALSLMALIAVIRGGSRIRPAAAVTAGVGLGLAVPFSPFLGGTFSLIFGAAAGWTALREKRIQAVLVYALAAVPVAAALAWCVASGTFEGAGGAVALGLSSRAAAAPLSLVALALGPIVTVALAGLVTGSWRQWPIATPLIGVVSGLCMLYFVTLTLEPVWVGWRAGQVILVLIPAVAAATFASMWDAGRKAGAVALGVSALLAGLPTTVIDAFNAQDVANRREASGFRWTVVIPADTQAAVAWIRDHTPEDAIVQMSIGPRRRESWTLVPTFGERRMAAGRPISLLQSAEYAELSSQADSIFAASDGAEAARLAHALRIDYLLVDEVERAAYGDTLRKFDASPSFSRVFERGAAAVYAVK